MSRKYEEFIIIILNNYDNHSYQLSNTDSIAESVL